MDQRPVPAVNPVPPVVLGLAAVIFGIEGLFSLGAQGLIGGPGAVGWRLGAARDWGVLDQLWEFMRSSGAWDLRDLARFVTYPFIHASFSHALFACVLILAIGNFAGRVFSGFAILILFFGSAALGALGFVLVLAHEGVLIGAYPGSYGLIGGFTYLMWTDLVETGGPQYRAFFLIALLMGVQLIFVAFFGAGLEWVADGFGFLSGFALSFILAPGGWRRLVGKIRRD